MTAETLGASQVRDNMLMASIKHAMTSSCMSLLKYVRLLDSIALKCYMGRPG